jgi:hypothetical protein
MTYENPHLEQLLELDRRHDDLLEQLESLDQRVADTLAQFRPAESPSPTDRDAA